MSYFNFLLSSHLALVQVLILTIHWTVGLWSEKITLDVTKLPACCVSLLQVNMINSEVKYFIISSVLILTCNKNQKNNGNISRSFIYKNMSRWTRSSADDLLSLCLPSKMQSNKGNNSVVQQRHSTSLFNFLKFE